MFLQYGAYGKLFDKKQQTPKIIERTPSSFQHNDQFAFSDFFMRKHPPNTQFYHVNQSKLQTPLQNKQPTRWILNGQNQETKQKISKDKICFIPNKKAFQIKFLNNKNKNINQLQSMLRKQSSQKFKDKRELIQQRRTRTNFSSTQRSSIRYYNENNTLQQNYSSLMQQYKVDQRKSMQLPQNCIDPVNQDNQQKGELNLINAYKIKSLVLGRNPKEEKIQKSKKFIKNLLQKKNSIKKINSSRTQSQKPLDKSSCLFVESSRLSTDYQNNKNNQLRLPSPIKQNFRKSTKLNSIFQNLNEQFRSEQNNLQPWTKNNQIQHFNDNIHDIDIDFVDFNKNNTDNQQKYMINVTGHRSTRNSFRKIYSTKQGNKMKGTICSLK